MTVDGSAVGQVRWGGQPVSFETSPGHHHVGVSFRYLGRNVGKAMAEVDVPSGAEVRLLYRSPWLVTNKGS